MGQSASTLEDVPLAKAAFEGKSDQISEVLAEGANITQSVVLPVSGQTWPNGNSMEHSCSFSLGVFPHSHFCMHHRNGEQLLALVHFTIFAKQFTQLTAVTA